MEHGSQGDSRLRADRRLWRRGGGAPDKLLYVSDLFTSRNLKGSRAAVVDP